MTQNESMRGREISIKHIKNKTYESDVATNEREREFER